MICGDANKNGNICLAEFEASADPKWAECVRGSRDRRAHTFYRFFEADNNFDAAVLTCLSAAMKDFDTQLAFAAIDANKDGKISKQEGYDTLSQINPSLE